MLTKKDIRDLLIAFKEVFLTKDDAKAFLTKDDAKSLFQTKNTAQTNHNQIILKLNAIEKRARSLEGDVKGLHDFIVPALGNLHEWTDEIHNEVVREKLLKRVKRLEKHVGLLPTPD